MAQRQEETTSPKSLFELLLGNLSDDAELMSTRERERLAERDIFSELSGEYEPLDESRLRVIDIQRRVARVPRLDRAIFESLAKLREEVSDLQSRVDELTELARNTAKIYNATIHELGDIQYELTMPIQVVIEEDEEETVARIPELNLYASADTDSEAINELKQEVIDLYKELESSDRKLGPLPQSWLETLRKLIVKKNG
ncbi:MAG: hypothetical protein OEZ00_02045 [Dehalococcoidia bacterium]|nr:hypothetical protein [Dehalococcoidia bacterium]